MWKPVTFIRTIVWWATLAVTCGQLLPCPEECECYFSTYSVLHADCSARDLSQLPQGIDIQTEVLDLSNNLFTSIPKEISSIIYLEKLNLSGNQIKILQSYSLSNLTQLVLLDLSRNLISRWEDIAPNYLLIPATNLRSLILSKNPLSNFANLRSSQLLISGSLHNLELHDCGINNIYGKSFLAGLSDIKRLSLAHNPLRRFQHLISPTLTSLDLSHCEINFIGADELNYLPSLTHLIISHNYRLYFQESIASFSIIDIDLSYCNMDHIKLSGFPNLEIVNLKGNMFRYLSGSEFLNNTKVKTLDLSSNALSSIHKNTFDSLISLKFLNLSVNVIPNIHTETFSKTRNLTDLVLSRNYISSLDPLNSPSLKTIDMSSCEIQSINPNAFDLMPSLQEINLARNLIGYIPDFLRSNSLQVLELSFNRLSTINNDTFTLLPKLRVLHLSENRFTDIWKSYYFSNNPNMEEIYLKDNTWRCECYDDEMKDFFSYLTNEPPKVWNINQLLCHSPSNVSGRNWLEACYFAWNPDSPLTPNQRILSFVLIVFAVFFFICFLVMLVKRIMRMKLKAAQEERERQAEEARDRLREARMRREQEQQRNAPDPRDLISPPSYDEALLMPRLDGSYHSLAGVGVTQEKKRERKKARRRTRSTDDLEADCERHDNRRQRRRRRSECEPEPQTPELEAFATPRLDVNIQEVTVHRLHESDF